MVIFMSKISYMEKLHNYHKIYEQLYEDPLIPIDTIARNTGLSRGTVSKYIAQMYEQDILIGPHLYLNPAPNHPRYVGLYTFSDPLSTYEGLKTFPHVEYTACTAGDWNILAITSTPLDFSLLKGFQTQVYWSTRGFTSAPLVSMHDWDRAFEDLRAKITGTGRDHAEPPSKTAPSPLNWGHEDWKLFDLFNHDIRQKITPVLKQAHIRYDTYRSWKKTLDKSCSCITMFFPEGFSTYAHHYFVLETAHPHAVTDIFSLLPTSSLITELTQGMLIRVHLKYPHRLRQLFCAIYNMQTQGIITRFREATMLFHSEKEGTG